MAVESFDKAFNIVSIGNAVADIQIPEAKQDLLGPSSLELLQRALNLIMTLLLLGVELVDMELLYTLYENKFVMFVILV